jgi:integrase
MASIVRLGGSAKNRVYAIEFTRPDGERKRWTLGSVGRSAAVEAKNRIECVVSRASLNLPLDARDQDWLRGLSPVLISRLARTGIVSPEILEAGIITLGQWIERYMAEGRSRWSSRTAELYTQTMDRLVAEFGAARILSTLNRHAGAAWVGSMRKSQLSEAMVRMQIRHAKACFTAAVNRGILGSNPLDGQVSASIASDRERFVTADETLRVMDQIQSPDMRAVLAFARFAGLRISSESHAVLWEDVDFEGGRFRVRAQKTKSVRTVPILPELRAVLLELADSLRVTAGPVVRCSKNNLTRNLKRAIERAGLDAWPKPWQTLRQAFVTDLRERFPSQVVAAWAGHSEAVATNHYALVLDSHFEQAAGSVCSGILSGMGANKAGIRGKFGPRVESGDSRKAVSDGNLRNGPARIRTGDRAIMSRDSEHTVNATKTGCCVNPDFPDVAESVANELESWLSGCPLNLNMEQVEQLRGIVLRGNTHAD